MPDTPLYVNILFFVVGLLIIIRGSDLFLDNAIWIAEASGVPQLVIGATIVSVCTTVPEMVSSSTAALRGAADMALGNAIGSVICNTGLIMGVMLVFITARVNRKTFPVRGLFLMAVMVLTIVLSFPAGVWRDASLLFDPSTVFSIGRREGFVLLGALGIYLWVNYLESKIEPPGLPVPVSRLHPEMARADARAKARAEWVRRGGFFALGGVLVGIGAFLLVEFGQRLARNLGISEAVVSLVFIAFGTSLPEVFTAISAVRKKAEQISVGNILGANVLNLAFVTGSAAVIRPLQFRDAMLIRFDVPFALGLTLIVFLAALIAGRLGRKTGIWLLLVYAGYMASLFLTGRVD